MNRFMFLFGFPAAVLFALGVGGTVPAAYAGPFMAEGTAVFQSGHANIDEGTLTGRSAPGGGFSGGYVQKATAGGDRLDGVAVFDYGNGKSLTLSYHLEFDGGIGKYVGDYVVTGGTGNWEGASGEGSLITGRGPSVGFIMAGTLEW